MKQINETFMCPVTSDATELTQMSCENTELGAYHTNMRMISGNIYVEYISKIRFIYKMTKRSDHHHHGLKMELYEI